MKDCSECRYYDKDAEDDPCFKCLENGFKRPYFVESDEGKAPRVVNEYTQLPWGQYIYR